MLRPSWWDALRGVWISDDPPVRRRPPAVGRNLENRLAECRDRLLRTLGGPLERLAHSHPLAVLRTIRRHPVLISAPLAALAIGAGIGAQALLRPPPSPAEAQLLDSLIANPQASSPASAPAAVDAAAQAQDAATAAAAGTAPDGAAADHLQAQRASRTTNAAGALVEPAAGPTLGLEIRVALLKLPGNPGFGASGPWRLIDREGRLLQHGTAGEAPDPAALLGSRSEVWLETSPGQHLLSAGRAYEGRFRILRGADGVQVINHLPLELYVSSVVGGEMPPGWNREALRAQAVAARSYALAHMARPADGQWHLGDTTRWQNYEGLSTVTASTRDATESTSGLILSYQGGIVESLYAATQQIVEEAHGHLGASMSQTGAQELAQQGLRYNEILGRYYQGASLARLQAGAS